MLDLETQLWVEADTAAQKLLANIHFEEFDKLRTERHNILKRKYMITELPVPLDVPPAIYDRSVDPLV